MKDDIMLCCVYRYSPFKRSGNCINRNDKISYISCMYTNNYLFYISGNICLCAMHGNLRGHPGRCDAYVVCVNHSGIMYPFGRLCIEADRCRNSITGVCTTDCSNITCTEEVPSGRCTYRLW